MVPVDEYQAWVQHRASPAGNLELGKETFTGVCAKCHGLAGQGDIGPNIAREPAARADRQALDDRDP